MLCCLSYHLLPVDISSFLISFFPRTHSFILLSFALSLSHTFSAVSVPHTLLFAGETASLQEMRCVVLLAMLEQEDHTNRACEGEYRWSNARCVSVRERREQCIISAYVQKTEKELQRDRSYSQCHCLVVFSPHLTPCHRLYSSVLDSLTSILLDSLTAILLGSLTSIYGIQIGQECKEQ